MKVPRIALLTCTLIAFLGLVLADSALFGSLSRAAIKFVNKAGTSEELNLDEVIASRKDTIAFSWQNFLDSPLIGIGFEVSKTSYFVQNASLFHAPIEKGFLPVAVLEETGLIGAFFFTVFIGTYVAHLAKAVNVPGLTMFLTFLAINCGEAMFFALAGHGAFAWLLFSAGVQLGNHCIDRGGKTRLCRSGNALAQNRPEVLYSS